MPLVKTGAALILYKGPLEKSLNNSTSVIEYCLPIQSIYVIYVRVEEN